RRPRFRPRSWRGRRRRSVASRRATPGSRSVGGDSWIAAGRGSSTARGDTPPTRGVTSFTGASGTTGSRTVALVADPDCNKNSCRLWAGTAGGGVWRTNNALAEDPVWNQMSPDDLDLKHVGSPPPRRP